MIKREKSGIVYYEFQHLKATGLVDHGFSSRIGGVSKPPYTSLNLAYHMGDQRGNVEENYRRICKVLSLNHENIVMSKQVHQTEIYHINRDCFQVPEGVDGLITALPNYVLTTYYADCVPLLFLDPQKKVIANSHAGWRGTAKNMAGKTVLKMVDQFGCQPQDILVGIGPGISAKHFEVGKKVVAAFERHFSQEISNAHQKSEHKWQLDLPEINRQLLLKAGILADHIEIAALCTYEDEQHFYSHRRDGNARGNMAAMIALKE